MGDNLALMVSVKDFPIRCMGLSDGWGWFDMSKGKALISLCAFLCLGVWVLAICSETWKNAQDLSGWTRITSRWGLIIFVKSDYKNQDSFCYLWDKKAGKFKEWLDCASLIDMKPNTPVMDVFSYLAYETVGQVRKESVFQCFLYSQTSCYGHLDHKETSITQALGSGPSMSRLHCTSISEV